MDMNEIVKKTEGHIRRMKRQTGGNDGALREGAPVRTVVHGTNWRPTVVNSARNIHRAGP